MSLNNKQSVPVKPSVSPRPRKKIKTKDSGIPWIGEIPANWEVRKLKQMVEFPVEKAKENTPYIGLENIVGFTAKYIETNGVYDLSQALSCIPQDVLFGKLRPYLGKAYIVEKPSCCSGEFVIFRNAPNSKFLLFTILSDGFIEFVNASTYGAKMPRANPDFIRNMSVPVPPAGTQKRIAEFLDKKCAEIDALIALQEKMITELKSYKQSVITEAVTRGVPANIKTSHRDAETQSVPVKPSVHPRSREKIKMKDSGIPWLGSIPAHWEVRKIKMLGILQGGNGFPEEFQGNFESEIPFIKVKSLAENPILKVGKDTISEEIRLTLKTIVIPRNSIVFAKVGAALLLQRFRKLDFSTCIDNNMMAFIPSEKILPDFFIYASSLFDFSLFVNPGTIPSVNQEQVGNIFIPFPDINIQKEIVDFLDSKTEEIDSMISLKQQKISTLQNYKKSVIFEYVTGKNEA